MSGGITASLDGFAAGVQVGAQTVRAATQRVAASVPGSTDEVGPVLASFLPGTKSGEPKVWPPPPSPWYFLFYALLIPIAPIAQGLAGDTNNALSRLAFLTIIPFGFLFGFIAVINDYIVMFSDPAYFFKRGSHRTPPFTWLGMDPDGQSPLLTLPSTAVPCAPPTFFETLVGSVGNMVKGPLVLAVPALRVASITSPAASSLLGAIESVINPTLGAARAAVGSVSVPVDAAAKAADVAVGKGRKAIGLASKVGNLVATGATALSAGAGAAAQPQMSESYMRPRYAGGGGQSGGGGGQGEGEGQGQLSSFDTVILTGIAALIGGGAILTAGRQYAWTTGPSDSPPLAGRV